MGTKTEERHQPNIGSPQKGYKDHSWDERHGVPSKIEKSQNTKHEMRKGQHDRSVQAYAWFLQQNTPFYPRDR